MATSAPALEWLKARWPSVVGGLVALTCLALVGRWIAGLRQAPPPRKVMQFTMVNVQPPAVRPPPPPTPPPPTPTPREEETPQSTRVELKASDLPPPEAARPPDAGGGGRLSLAAEGEGAGDAFNLTGNPGGRGLLSGGGLGDGTGQELGSGGGAGSRYGWYYKRMEGEIQAAVSRLKGLSAASVRVELRVWADPSGRITRLQLIRSTGDEKVDAAIQSVVGLMLHDPPAPDVPMPAIFRLTARRPG
jgi:TonB family protein